MEGKRPERAAVADCREAGEFRRAYEQSGRALRGKKRTLDCDDALRISEDSKTFDDAGVSQGFYSQTGVSRRAGCRQRCVHSRSAVAVPRLFDRRALQGFKKVQTAGLERDG